MKKSIILSLVLLIVLCSCDGFVGNTTTNSNPTSETTFTPTIFPTLTATSTPYPEYDTIYFWWWDGNKNVKQLWELVPHGQSRMLYEVAPLQSPEEALNSGLLTENDLKILKDGPAIQDPNLPPFKGEKINISPQSLQLSPDRQRIAWDEKILYYCVDSYTCINGYIIRVFNIEDGKLETSISIPIGEETITPIWSPDSKKLAFFTKQTDSDSPNNVVHIFDIATATTVEFTGVNDDYPYSGRYKWMPDSNGIVLGNGNGLFLITLNDQKINHIFSPNNWWIFDIAISPNGDFLLFTGINILDAPTTPHDSMDNMSDSNSLLYLFDLNTNTLLRPVINKNGLGRVSSIYWLPDSQRFIYLHTLSSIEAELFVRNVSSDEIIMDEKLPFEVDDVFHWQKSQLSKDGSSILFVSSSYNESTSVVTNSLIIYNLNTQVWNKVLLPAEIQKAWGEEKGLDKYFLSSPTW